MWFWEKGKKWMVRFSFFVVTEVQGPRFKGGGYMDQLHWSRNRRPRIGTQFPYVVPFTCSSGRPILSSHLPVCTALVSLSVLNTVGIILYRDYLYVNLYQMPILYVEIDI